MVKLDESNIPIQWFCPPCDRQENPHKYQNSTDINSKTPISKTVTKTTGKLLFVSINIFILSSKVCLKEIYDFSLINKEKSFSLIRMKY